MAYIVKVNIIIYNEQASLEYNIKNILEFSATIIVFMTVSFYKELFYLGQAHSRAKAQVKHTFLYLSSL